MSRDFRKSKPIYVQIAENFHDKVLLGTYNDHDKIPSIRELAVLFEVNPNTVQRSYELLQSQEVIYTKRGLGYFVGAGAKEKVLQSRKEAFVTNELPYLFRNMILLDIDLKTLEQQFEHFKKTFKDETK